MWLHSADLLQLSGSEEQDCAVPIASVASPPTTRLGAGPRGGLAHTQHRLVLDAIQPASRQASAADPSHHGDVAVPEEAMRKIRHGERR